MNERVKQLMIRAIGGVPCYDASVGLSLNQEEAEKFAELIVKECAEKAYAGVGPDSLDAYDRGWQNGRNSAAQVIKEHFGVEE
jgi:hypothetical protein